MCPSLHSLSLSLSLLFQAIDEGHDDVKRIKTVAKYLKDNSMQSIQSQMRIAMALKEEGVLSERVWYTLHTLIAGNNIGKNLEDPFLSPQDPINKQTRVKP